MKKPLPENERDLRRQIDKSDRRFRIAQSVFMVAVICGLILVLGVLFDRYDKQQEQLRNAVAELKEDNSAQLSRQTKYIECIAQIFAQSDRGSIVLKDFEDCMLVRVESSAAGQNRLEPSSAPSPKPQQKPQSPSSSDTPNTPVEPASECPTIVLLGLCLLGE